jgi:hypothetical protein
VTTTERQRIAAILGMLGSSHAGERDNAARAAEAFRRKHGLTWDELLRTPTAATDEWMARAAEASRRASEAQTPKPPPPPPKPEPKPEWSAEEQNEWLNHSEWVLRQKVGDKKVEAAIAYFQAATASDPSLSQRLYEQADPYGWVLAQMEEAQRQQSPRQATGPQRWFDDPWMLGWTLSITAATFLILAYFHV